MGRRPIVYVESATTFLACRPGKFQRRITGDLAVPGVLYSWRRKNQALSFLGLMKKANGREHDVEVSWTFSFTLKVRRECRVHYGPRERCKSFGIFTDSQQP